MKALCHKIFNNHVKIRNLSSGRHIFPYEKNICRKYLYKLPRNPPSMLHTKCIEGKITN